MPRTFELQGLISELNEQQRDRLEFLYEGLIDGKLSVRCRIHGCEKSITPGALRRGQCGCDACTQEAKEQGFARRSEKLLREQIEAATKVHGGKFVYNHLVGSPASGYVTLKCPEHGEFSVWWHNHIKGVDCPVCASVDRGSKTLEQHWNDRKQALLTALSEASYTTEWNKETPLRATDKLLVCCGEHPQYEVQVNKFLAGQRCVMCHHKYRAGRDVAKRAAETFIAKAVGVHGEAYDYSQVKYVTNHDKVAVRCKKHDRWFYVSPNNHLAGKGCPSCGVQISRNEDEIAEFLKPYVEVVQRDRKVLSPYELDIYLPEHKLAIEHHGLFWHTDEKVGADHKRKWEMCHDLGIELWQIFEDEWATKADVIKQRLLARIGRAGKVGARDCELRVIDADTAKIFLDEVHIQGAKNGSSVEYGLFKDEVLLAVATFGRSRSGAMVPSGDGWEVLRYASKGTVVGGFGKLFSRFVADYSPSYVVSFCDLRYGNGRLYNAVGFELHSITEPDYWWLPRRGGKQRIPRYQTQKHKLKTHQTLKEFYKDELSERQICEAAGWQRISGVGHQRWLWTSSPVCCIKRAPTNQ